MLHCDNQDNLFLVSDTIIQGKLTPVERKKISLFERKIFHQKVGLSRYCWSSETVIYFKKRKKIAVIL